MINKEGKVQDTFNSFVKPLSKKIINISLANAKVKFNKEKIIVTFTQNYKSGALNQTSNKTLVFKQEDSRWLILEETSK